MALITKEVLKSDWLDLAPDDPTRDDMIDRIIAHVGSEIRTYCGQPIEQTDEILYFTGTGRASYPTTYTVPTSLTTLHARTVPTDSWAVVTGSTPTMYEVGGVQYIYFESFSDVFYKATILAGYTPIPEDVKLCAFELTKEVYYMTPFAKDQERFGVAAITDGDAGISFSRALKELRPKMVERLAKYRKIVL